jgi:hypothetical protein
MNEKDIELDIFRVELSRFFSSQKYFIVKSESSDKGECDHIFLSPPLHSLLSKKNIDFNHEKYTFGAIQRDIDKIRLRFYKRNIDHYKGLRSVFEKYKLKSTFYNHKDSNEAYCFDYYIVTENKNPLIVSDLELLIEYIRRIVILAKKHK